MPEQLDRLISENVVYLEQIHELLIETSREWYVEMRPPFARGSIGKHVRHVLEFYQLVLNANAGVVDYDSRERDERLEQDPERAASFTTELKHSIQRRAGSQDESLVLVYSDGESSQEIGSTFGRELMFLTSHTVHHMAIIRMIYELLGGSVPDSFGVAPSTLRHEKAAG